MKTNRSGISAFFRKTAPRVAALLFLIFAFTAVLPACGGGGAAADDDDKPKNRSSGEERRDDGDDGDDDGTDASPNNDGTDASPDNDGADAVTVVPTAASGLTLTEKDTEAFTMQIPDGWELRYGWDGEKMLLIRVYDPKQPVNQIFYATDMVPFMKSAASAQVYSYSGTVMFSEAPILDPPTNETLFQQIPKLRDYYLNTVKSDATAAMIPEIYGFTMLEKLPAGSAFSNDSLDDSIIHGTFRTADGGAEGEGIGFASIVDLFGEMISPLYGVDISYYNVYNFTAITGVKDEFVNYEELLCRSFASLKLKQEFVAKMLNNSEAAFQQMQEINASITAAYDNYNNAWLARSKSSDIARQKQSDATLGYERVYDTETGEIYKAYNGFTQDYTGTRYRPITDDMYAQGWNGYIEK